MYTVQQRSSLLEHITTYIKESPAFEGLLQIGSGAVGFADIYSDIDLMAGCYDDEAVFSAKEQLQQFFTEMDACHIEQRAWSKTALGFSVYFENGLSVDLSFMPTEELPIRSNQYKIVFSKTERFLSTVEIGSQKLSEKRRRYGVDDSVHYRFINELRYVEIALRRGELIFADIALGNARQLLLAVETVIEGKKLHQFKDYNSLDKTFLTRLANTYANNQSYEVIFSAKEKLLSLYLDTVNSCGFLHMDSKLLKLLNCFD